VTIHDLQATILHLMGIDPYKLGVVFDGLNQRLIGPTNEAKILKQIIC
jgi:hypothetical protein